VEAPSVDNVTCREIDVMWSSWSASTDIGTDTLDIASYTSVYRVRQKSDILLVLFHVSVFAL